MTAILEIYQLQAETATARVMGTGLCVQETPLEGRRLSCFQTGALGESHNMILQVSSFCRGYRVVRVHNSVGITLQWKQVSSLYSLQMVTVLGSGLLFKSHDECMLV